jgi:hypothetical protein
MILMYLEDVIKSLIGLYSEVINFIVARYFLRYFKFFNV